ncbi:MAG TPA: hypothetical protein VMB03_00780 [Bryobacteraceae bacterium]|nr:hypothetical protein [Bryobacteraceae bacterium]
MKHKIVPALFAVAAFGQTATTPVTFPAIPLPAAVSAFGEFNQLGTPRFTMGISAVYPVVGSAGIYGTSTADILPKLATDPTTRKHFYAIQSSIRQGFHKDILDTGRASFLIGADVGPSFSQSQTSGLTVNFSSSLVATAIYQITPVFSFILPVRMLYIDGIGWNPIAEAGVLINLRNLPKAK